MHATFAHIAATNPGLNAFQHLDEDGAMVQARASEARWQRGASLGPVDGVPTTIKDNVLTIGWPTLSGSRTINPDKALSEDAPGTRRNAAPGSA